MRGALMLIQSARRGVFQLGTRIADVSQTSPRIPLEAPTEKPCEAGGWSRRSADQSTAPSSIAATVSDVVAPRRAAGRKARVHHTPERPDISTLVD